MVAQGSLSKPARAPRPLGLRIIITYKFVKSPLVLALALFLSLSPRAALHASEALVRDLSEGHALFGRLAHWLELHVTSKALAHAAMLAWLDGIATGVEGVLLWRGHAWGEWVVVAALAALVPFEILSLERHPTWLKVTILVLNAASVAYLVWRRLERFRPRES